MTGEHSHPETKPSAQAVTETKPATNVPASVSPAPAVPLAGVPETPLPNASPDASGPAVPSTDHHEGPARNED